MLINVKHQRNRLSPEVFRSSMWEAECAFRCTLKTGKPVIGRVAPVAVEANAWKCAE
jgi:hypothetical protein